MLIERQREFHTLRIAVFGRLTCSKYFKLQDFRALMQHFLTFKLCYRGGGAVAPPLSAQGCWIERSLKQSGNVLKHGLAWAGLLALY